MEGVEEKESTGAQKYKEYDLDDLSRRLGHWDRIHFSAVMT